MSRTTVRRKRRPAGYAVVVAGLVLVGGGYAAISGQDGSASAADAGGPSPQAVAAGQQLYAVTCASCHGFAAQGTSQAPSLVGVGSAAVNFQVSTGRMPGKLIGPEMLRGPVTLKPNQISDLGAYIQSLGGGPEVPSAAQVDPAGADLALGQSLFITDCAQCHGFAGAGGDLTYGKTAPPLTQATPQQIYEAMLTGPEAMPVFSDTTITPAQKRDIIGYVTTIRSEPNPGGFSLGRQGPVTEGLVAFLVGIAGLIFAAMWITMRRRGEA